MELHIPSVTLIKTLLFGLLAYLLWTILPVLLLFYIALLIAVIFMPFVERMGRTRFGRGIGITLSALAMVGVLSAVIFILMPALAEQISNLSTGFPQLQTSILDSVPAGVPRNSLQKLFTLHPFQNPENLFGHLIVAGEYALGGLSGFLLILIFSVYVLADGSQAYAWLRAYLKDEYRRKADESVREISKIMFAYVVGQGFTSLVCAIYAYVVLICFGVPGALMLAILAGIFDMLPVLGFFVSGVPAVLLALSVSTNAALGVLALYIFYHGLENYFIMPKIYGNRLKLSGIAVLGAFVIGALVGGVLGAVAILPLVASYPVIERIWLAKYVRRDAIRLHNSDT